LEPEIHTQTSWRFRKYAVLSRREVGLKLVELPKDKNTYLSFSSDAVCSLQEVSRLQIAHFVREFIVNSLEAKGRLCISSIIIIIIIIIIMFHYLLYAGYSHLHT
jgi:hypothetical protein